MKKSGAKKVAKAAKKASAGHAEITWLSAKLLEGLDWGLPGCANRNEPTA